MVHVLPVMMEQLLPSPANAQMESFQLVVGLLLSALMDQLSTLLDAQDLAQEAGLSAVMEHLNHSAPMEHLQEDAPGDVEAEDVVVDSEVVVKLNL